MSSVEMVRVTGEPAGGPMIQVFELALLAVAATGIVVFGARAATAARFSRELRAYAEPVQLRGDVSLEHVPRQRAS